MIREILRKYRLCGAWDIVSDRVFKKSGNHVKLISDSRNALSFILGGFFAEMRMGDEEF